MNQNKPNTSAAATTAQDIYFSALIMGEWGSGKTRLFLTVPRPLLVEAFENSVNILSIIEPAATCFITPATTADEIRALYASGKTIFIRKFGKETHKHPTVYATWRKTFDRDLRLNADNKCFYDLFATVGLDSFTGWNEAVVNFIIKKFNHKVKQDGTERPLGVMAQSDYPHLYKEVEDMINLYTDRNWHFIMTAHLDVDQDPVTGKNNTSIRAFKTLRTTIPSKVTEKLVMRRTALGTDQKFELITGVTGKYRASTVFGADKWSLIEKPDIRALLKKANLPYQDKEMK